MHTHSTGDLHRIGRIIQLIKLHRQGCSPMSLCLSRDQYLKYYLSAGDWAFWQALKTEEADLAPPLVN